jgi:hypothetical protein
LGLTIAELPFHERPVLELLNLDVDRDEPAHDYAGYGWARVPRIWLIDAAGERRAVDDAVVLALHTADDAPAHPGDLELEFELPDRPVAAMLSRFLAVWLPRLPRDAGAIVLAVCNPHATVIPVPADATAPVLVPTGDVTSWIDRDAGEIQLVAGTWSRLAP